MTSWLDAVPSDVLEVARMLHVPTTPQRGASGGAFAPCPACGAERRHPTRRDRRLACGVRADGAGWRCHECDVSGDAIDLAAWVLGGARMRDLDQTARDRVREYFAGPMPAPRVASRAPAPVVERAPSYPDAGEVRELWQACAPVVDHDLVRAYLGSRSIDAGIVADRDLARALPEDVALPPWARFAGASWSSHGYALIVPMVDACGRLRSLLARRVVESETPKSIAPAGHSRAALVLACPLARQVLERGARPEWWAVDRLRIVIAEGEVDYLANAARMPDDEHAPATIGIGSGAWSAAIAARIPDRSDLVIATDPDEAGEKYASAIVASMSARPSISLSRWRPAS